MRKASTKKYGIIWKFFPTWGGAPQSQNFCVILPSNFWHDLLNLAGLADIIWKGSLATVDDIP